VEVLFGALEHITSQYKLFLLTMQLLLLILADFKRYQLHKLILGPPQQHLIRDHAVTLKLILFLHLVLQEFKQQQHNGILLLVLLLLLVVLLLDLKIQVVLQVIKVHVLQLLVL